MIGDKRVLAVIPARGGSKGVLRKNIRVIAGKPLLAYTIDAAKQSRYLDEIVVSSDDSEILKVADEWGAIPLARPSQLARDESPGMDPVLHALTIRTGYDYIVLLQPTSPLRTVDDINGAIEYCMSSSAPACVSICETEMSPYSAFELKSGGRLHRFMSIDAPNRRQDLPPLYVVNGAFYFAEVSWLHSKLRFLSDETVGYCMPIERSLDIDTELDLLFFEFLLERRLNAGVN